MKHWKLGLGAVDLVKGRVRGDFAAMNEVQQEFEELLTKPDFFKGAPFKWITLMYLYGTTHNTAPLYRRRNEKYGDLPISIQLDMAQLNKASKAELEWIFMTATLEALIHVGEKYKLPTDVLKQRRESLLKEKALNQESAPKA
jgi:hypothetical protein